MERYLRALPLISILFSGCYFDIFSSNQSQPTRDTTQHISGFSYNNYDKQQVNDWSINGKESTINKDRSLNLIKPHLHIKKHQNPIYITGEKGGWNPQTEEIKIYDNVIAKSNKMGIFTTNSLIYSSPSKDFKTNDNVHFKHKNISIDGKALEGNTKTESIKILTNVKVVIKIKR